VAVCKNIAMKTKAQKNRRGRPAKTISLSREDVQAWLKTHEDGKIGIKLRAMLSISEGIPVQTVCRVLGVSREAIRKWHEAFEREGADGLALKSGRGRRGIMTKEMRETLDDAVIKSPRESGYEVAVWTAKVVKRFVKDRFAEDISERTARNWLKTLGFTLQRPRPKLIKADPDKRQSFRDELKKRKKKER
jgi:transposase